MQLLQDPGLSHDNLILMKSQNPFVEPKSRGFRDLLSTILPGSLLTFLASFLSESVVVFQN